MPSSPETAPPPENTTIDPSPQKRPPPPFDATSPEPAPGEHDETTPTPPPPPHLAKSPEADEEPRSPPLTDGTALNPEEVGPPTQPSPASLAHAASPAQGAASSEKPPSPPPQPPGEAVAASSAEAAGSPPSVPQITVASPEALAPSPPSSPALPEMASPPVPFPAQTAYASTDAAAAEAVVVTPEEAARSPTALETIDLELDTAHPPRSPPLPSEIGVEESLPQPRSPSHWAQAAPGSPEMPPPGFENLEYSQLPPPPAETMDDLPYAAATKVAAMTSEEVAHQMPALEATDVEMDTAPAMPPPLGSGVEDSLLQPQLKSPSPDMAPPGFEILESSRLLWSPSPPAETTDTSPDTAATVAAAPALEVMDVEMETAPLLPLPVGSGAQGSLPQPQPKLPSPDMAPPGFENLEPSQLMPLPPPSPAEITDTWRGTVATNAVPALEAMDAEMETAPPLPLPVGSKAEGSLSQPPSPPAQAAPCSSETAPPGYENLESSQLLLPPPPPCPIQEMGQMVCGSCHELLAYPRGAVHVQCTGCRTINLVLEAHEVGTVNCGQCNMLLMYPFGALAVRCSICLFVTEIKMYQVHPPASVQQGMQSHPSQLIHQG